MKIVVLGGSGQAGRAIVRMLLDQTSASVAITARRLEKAQAVVSDCPSADQRCRASAQYADASNLESLRVAFRGASLVIVTSTTARYTENVAKACLDVNCDYVDILDAPETVGYLERLSPELTRAGRLFVTQGGFAPGLPAALVRLGRSRFERVAGVRLGLAMSLKTAERYEQAYDVFDFLVKARPMAFEHGDWRQKSMRDVVDFDFGSRFGRRPAFLIDMPELRSLPGQIGLEGLALYGAGTNAALDCLLRSLIIVLHNMRPRLGWRTLARLLFWMSKRNPREPSGCSLVLEATGRRHGGDGGLRVQIEHQDNYYATAAVVLAFLRQYAAGDLDATGVRMMGHLIDPDRTIRDLLSSGLTVSIDEGVPQQELRK